MKKHNLIYVLLITLISSCNTIRQNTSIGNGFFGKNKLIKNDHKADKTDAITTIEEVEYLDEDLEETTPFEVEEVEPENTPTNPESVNPEQLQIEGNTLNGPVQFVIDDSYEETSGTENERIEKSETKSDREADPEKNANKIIIVIFLVILLLVILCSVVVIAIILSFL